MLSRLVVPVVFLFALLSVGYILSSFKTQPTQPKTPAEVLGPFTSSVEIKAINLTDQNDQKINLLPSFKEPTLLTFWSIDCGECAIGLPVINQFAQNHPELKFVLVDVKNEPAKAKLELTNLKVNLPTYFDQNGDLFNAWQATMPSSFLIKDGRVNYIFPGRVSQDHLQALLTLN